MQLTLTPQQRDTVIRTIAGEAAGEGPQGWTAAGAVIFNRAADGSFPGGSDPAAVSTARNQFSTWNPAQYGGNQIPHTISPNSAIYQQIGNVVDGLASGQIADPTNGAVYYNALNQRPPGTTPTGQIGHHYFYSTPQSALAYQQAQAGGAPSAFAAPMADGQTSPGNLAIAAPTGGPAGVTPPGVPTPTPRPNYSTVRYGSTGPQVAALQTMLKQQGLYPGNVDGIAGPQTTAAIRAAERAGGPGMIKDTGVAGPQVWTNLINNTGGLPMTTGAYGYGLNPDPGNAIVSSPLDPIPGAGPGRDPANLANIQRPPGPQPAFPHTPTPTPDGATALGNGVLGVGSDILAGMGRVLGGARDAFGNYVLNPLVASLVPDPATAGGGDQPSIMGFTPDAGSYSSELANNFGNAGVNTYGQLPNIIRTDTGFVDPGSPSPAAAPAGAGLPRLSLEGANANAVGSGLAPGWQTDFPDYTYTPAGVAPVTRAVAPGPITGFGGGTPMSTIMRSGYRSPYGAGIGIPGTMLGTATPSPGFFNTSPAFGGGGAGTFFGAGMAPGGGSDRFGNAFGGGGDLSNAVGGGSSFGVGDALSHYLSSGIGGGGASGFGGGSYSGGSSGFGPGGFGGGGGGGIADAFNSGQDMSNYTSSDFGGGDGSS